jgi:hypothetical protein
LKALCLIAGIFRAGFAYDVITALEFSIRRNRILRKPRAEEWTGLEKQKSRRFSAGRVHGLNDGGVVLAFADARPPCSQMGLEPDRRDFGGLLKATDFFIAFYAPELEEYIRNVDNVQVWQSTLNFLKQIPRQTDIFACTKDDAD